MALWGEFLGRLHRRLLPATTDTRDLAALFELLFGDEADEDWIAAIDDELLARLSLLFAAAPDGGILGGLNDVLFGTTGPRGAKHDGLAQTMAKSAIRTMGSSVGREIIRGVLGGIFGGRKGR
jgi:hypothetical protein